MRSPMGESQRPAAEGGPAARRHPWAWYAATTASSPSFAARAACSMARKESVGRGVLLYVTCTGDFALAGRTAGRPGTTPFLGVGRGRGGGGGGGTTVIGPGALSVTAVFCRPRPRPDLACAEGPRKVPWGALAQLGPVLGFGNAAGAGPCAGPDGVGQVVRGHELQAKGGAL